MRRARADFSHAQGNFSCGFQATEGQDWDCRLSNRIGGTTEAENAFPGLWIRLAISFSDGPQRLSFLNLWISNCMVYFFYNAAPVH